MSSQPYLGGIFLFAGNFAPRGYFLCQGQLLSISQFSALFAILGTTYGGNGTTTFALPDLQGREPVGWGNGAGLGQNELGEIAGTPSSTILFSNVPAMQHTHGINVSTAAAVQASPQNNFLAVTTDGSGNSNPANYNPTPMANANLGLTSVSQTITGGTGPVPFSIEDPYLVLNYIIAWEGVFPTRS